MLRWDAGDQHVLASISCSRQICPVWHHSVEEVYRHTGIPKESCQNILPRAIIFHNPTCPPSSPTYYPTLNNLQILFLLLTSLALITFPHFSNRTHTYPLTMATNGTSVKGQLAYVLHPNNANRLAVEDNVDTSLTSLLTAARADSFSHPSPSARATPTRLPTRFPTLSSMLA